MKKQLLITLLLLQSLTFFSQKKLDVMQITYFQDQHYTEFYHYYTYDGNGNHMETQIFEDDEYNQAFLQKDLFTYDVDNNLTEVLMLDENLDNQHKLVYSYNSNGVSEINTFNWNSTNWVAEKIINYQYNADSFLEKKLVIQMVMF